jgi:NTE family protein
VFSPVRIDNELYLDGGLRQNTPISPALRLGATHIFAVGSSREVQGRVLNEGGAPSHAKAPGAAFLMGKVLNAFLLDHFDVDMELLSRLNHVITDGTAAYGGDFTNVMNQQALTRHVPPYRYVRTLTVRPSEDIGRLASEHVRKGKFRGDPLLAGRLFSLLDIGVATEADLASYLLFDGAFCRQLIEMGRADAQARREDLLAFFGDAEEDREAARASQELGPTGSSSTHIRLPRTPFEG